MKYKMAAPMILFFSSQIRDFHFINIKLILFLLFFIINETIQDRLCVHEFPDKSKLKYGMGNRGRFKRNTDEERNIEIYTHYDPSCDLLTNDEITLVKDTMMTEATLYFNVLLKVKNPISPIRLHRDCVNGHYFDFPSDDYQYCVDECSVQTYCGYVEVPDEHLEQCHVCTSDGQTCEDIGEQGSGVDSVDFIVYISCIESDRCQDTSESTVAYATYCQLEAQLDRPVAGHVNFCPSQLSISAHDAITMLSTVKHELFHALGFSAGLFAFWRDENGDPRTSRDGNGLPDWNPALGVYQWNESMVLNVTSSDWLVRDDVTTSHTTYLLTTANVRAAAREHFNCDSLEGGELENQGSSGTMLTHWEKRVLENEAMTGTHTQARSFSKLTLAAMQDTGWYTVDFDQADSLSWGKNLGCSFATNSCRYWMLEQSSNGESVEPYCNVLNVGSPLKMSCGIDNDAVVLCNLQEHSTDLPLEYQYFDSISGVSSDDIGRYGGSVELSDYCPYYQEVSWVIDSDSDSTRGSWCKLPANYIDDDINYGLETYSETSMCLIQSAASSRHWCNSIQYQTSWGGGCYIVTCTADVGLSVVISDTEYICYHYNQTLFINVIYDSYLYQLELVCPNCTEYCEGSGVTCPADSPSPEISITTDDSSVPCRGLYNTTIKYHLYIILIIATGILRR